MARRRSSKKSSSRNNQSQLVFKGLLILAIGGILVFVFGLGKGKAGKEPDTNFSIAQYRQDGSRFASTGNKYLLKAKVEHIETHGGDRLIIVSLPRNRDERLPLLMPAGTVSSVNITRGDSFLFDVSCRTGRSEEGTQVKGILVVNHVVTQ